MALNFRDFRPLPTDYLMQATDLVLVQSANDIAPKYMTWARFTSLIGGGGGGSVYLQQGTNITITGTGVLGDPYVINSTGGSSLPSQTGNASKVLGTNGTTAAWQHEGAPYFNVRNYGAVGDGTTDDRNAIAAAITALDAAGGGVLFFPAGNFKMNSSITITNPIRILGVGAAGALTNSYTALPKDSFGPVKYSSKITFADNIDGFSITTAPGEGKPHVIIQNLYFTANDAGTNTSGSMVKIDGMNQDAIIENCTFYGGFVQLEILSAYHYHVDKCSFSAPAKACIKTTNTIRTDTGDMTISFSTFSSGTFVTGTGTSGTMAIWWYGGGGVRLIGNKFDACSFVTAHQFSYDFYGTNILDDTSDIIIMANSFENYKNTAIRLVGVSAPQSVRNIQISTNQFASTGADNSCIDINNMKDIIITDFLIRNWNATITGYAIKVTNSDWVTIGEGQIKDYSDDLITTGSTNVELHWKWAAGSTGKIWTWPGVWEIPAGTIVTNFVDTFTRADSAITMGNAETPNTTPWVPVVGTWGISSNKAYCASATTSGATVTNLVTADIGAADFTMNVVYTCNGGTGNISESQLIFRETDINNHLLLDITNNNGAPSINLYKRVAGTYTLLSGTTSYAVSGTHTYTIITSGATISIQRDGGPSIITAVDAFNNTATKVGFVVLSGTGFAGNVDRFDGITVA
jgi:hypothetical protein